MLTDYETLGGTQVAETEYIDYRDAPTKIQGLPPISQIASGHHSAALTESGALYFWGTGAFGVYPVPQLVSELDLVDLSVGGCFGAAVDRDGLIWTWGANSQGELGQGHTSPRGEPFPVSTLKNKHVGMVACGGAFAIALGKTKQVPIQKPKKKQVKESVLV